MDLVSLVGWRVLAGDLLDYVRLRAVCTHWRSSLVCPLGRGVLDPRFHPRRWMMLPEGHGLHPGDGKKRFFNPSTGSFARVRLPLLTDHDFLASVEGLLLLADRRDPAMILHPFTGDIVKLPPLMPLLETYWESVPGIGGRLVFIPLNFVASLSVSADGTAAVMMVHQYLTHVFFATTNDKQWRVSSWSLTPLSKAVSFRGKLYILAPPASCGGEQPIMQLDPPRYEHATMPSSLMPPKLIATCPKGQYNVIFSLAECDSEILLIAFKNMPIRDKLVVYKVADLALGKVAPISSIGGNTLFLDIEKSMYIQNGDIILSRSMTSSSRVMPTIASDTICHSQNYPFQYHLGTGKWSQIMGECGNDGYNMANGCNCGLIYHIYKCCHCTVKDTRSYVFKI
jgi:hypothetical protein